MDGQLVHFEIPAQDGARAMEFWKSLFGWKFQAWDGPVEYHMLDGNEPGGAIYPDSDTAGSGPIVYFGTSDIDASIAKARELGGSADDKQPIPAHRLVRALRRHRGQPLLALPERRVGAGARRGLAAQQPRGVEQLQLGRGRAEDRACDELAAGEAHHVAVPGVAGRDPDVVAARGLGRRAASGPRSCRRSRPSGGRCEAPRRAGRRRTRSR